MIESSISQRFFGDRSCTPPFSPMYPPATKRSNSATASSRASRYRSKRSRARGPRQPPSPAGCAPLASVEEARVHREPPGTSRRCRSRQSIPVERLHCPDLQYPAAPDLWRSPTRPDMPPRPELLRRRPSPRQPPPTQGQGPPRWRLGRRRAPREQDATQAVGDPTQPTPAFPHSQLPESPTHAG